MPVLLADLAFSSTALVAIAASNATSGAKLWPPPVGMWGMAAAVFVLILLLGVLLRREQRRKLRAPFALMLSWAVATIFWGIPYFGYAVRDWCELISLVTLSLAAVRVGWLLVVDWGLQQGSALGISQITRDLVQSALYIVTAIAAARAAGADATAIATTGGLVTAGLTFSLQQTLSDLVAGILLQAQAPFKVGDWISYDGNSNIVGRVGEINWRATKVVTNDGVEVTIPNSVLARAAIVNYHEPTIASRRSVYFDVGYQHPPRMVQKLALEAIRGADGVLDSPPPSCLVADFAASGVRYWLRYFIKDMEVRDVIDSGVRVRLWYALRRARVDFVFPRMDLSFVGTSESERTEAEQRERQRRVHAFEKIDFLSPLTASERAELASRAKTHLFARGETIVREGERTTEFYIVAEGELSVCTEAARGEIARLSAGDFFGEMALLTGEPRNATVRAVDDCVLYVIDKPTFQTVIAGHKDLLEKVSKIVAERQAEMARRRGQPDETNEQRALREASLLTRMRRFFGGD